MYMGVRGLPIHMCLDIRYNKVMHPFDGNGLGFKRKISKKKRKIINEVEITRRNKLFQKVFKFSDYLMSESTP